MSDEDIHALAKRFFDCIEAADIEGLADCYAPNAVIWHNTDWQAQTAADSLDLLRRFSLLIRDRSYGQRRAHVFAGGFVHQHVLTGVRQDGVRVSLAACLVCRVENGRIIRLDEYFDGAQAAEFVKAP